MLKQLQGVIKYRLDTNYAKIDRIEHSAIEAFKREVMRKTFFGRTIKGWGDIVNDLPQSVYESMNSQIDTE